MSETWENPGMNTLAADLDRLRNLHRARRIAAVLAALQVRREEQRLRGRVQPTLDHAIRDFTVELRQLDTLA